MANKKKKSVLEIAREMETRQKKFVEEQQTLAYQKMEEERKVYEEQLRQERLELIRLKQGIISESETIHEEQSKKTHYTIWQKIGNFFYHSKWWLGIASVFLFLIVFLTWQVMTTVHPDMIILLLIDDEFNYTCKARISKLFAQYIEDENGDGATVV